MDSSQQFQVNELKAKLEFEGKRYATAIRDGNFIEATHIKNIITQLHIELDKLMPFKQKK